MSVSIIRPRDLKENEILKITAPPRVRSFPTKTGTVEVEEIQIQRQDGTKGWIRLNMTSYRNLTDKYGSDTGLWIGKAVKVIKRSMKIAGRSVAATILEPTQEALPAAAPAAPAPPQLADLHKAVLYVAHQTDQLLDLLKKTRTDISTLSDAIHDLSDLVKKVWAA